MVTAAALALLAALSAEELLERSIRYHDPDGKFARGSFTLTLSESRPDERARKTEFQLDNAESTFEFLRPGADGSGMTFRVRGEEVLDSSELAPERALRTRNYYLYLYGLPMKLRDPGTRLHPEVHEKTFEQTPAYELKVTYDEEVGGDTWYFYLERDSYALIGYRFYHDESKNDGEYIVLEGEAEGAGLRLPRHRKWYRHQDDGYLGTDTIESIK